MRLAPLLVSSAIALALPATAYAQTVQSDGPSSAATAEATDPQTTQGQTAQGQTAQDGPGLGDIVVTAQRREESSQRAAVAIDVVSGADLIAAGVTQADRLNEQVPALTIQPTSTGNLVFIRGVGNFTLTPNSDPATAFNYDGVYVGRPTGTNGVFFDLERVEVLKGPQGTLYGRNATAGAINIIPVQPQLGKLAGYGSVSYGNYNTLTAEGAINVPLGEDGAFRLSGSHAEHDGYFRDGTTDQDDYSLRAQLKAKLTPTLTVRVAGDYAHIGGVGTSVSYNGNYLFNPVAGRYAFVPAPTDIKEGIFTPAAQAFRQTIPAGPAGRRLTALDIYPFQNSNFYGVNAQIDADLGFGTLTIIPAWRYGDENYLSSAGGFAYRQRQKNEQFSLEARLTGNRVGIFDYVVGGFLYDERLRVRTALSLAAAANFLVNDYRTKSFAPFGRLTAHLTDSLRVVGGVRYTQDKKRFTGTTIGNTIVCTVRVPPVVGAPSCPTVPLFPFFEDISQSPIPLPAANSVRPILNNGVPTGAIISRADRFDDSRLKNNRVTYRGAVEFDLAERSLLYASVETGYRSGGFNPATGFESYEPEYITAFTVGSKNRFFDNRVQINVEAFWWKYRNQQVSAVRNDLDGRTANITQNIGSARIRGVEVEGRVLVTPTTLLSTDIQYLDADNRDFVYQQANTGTPPLVGCGYALNAATNIYNVNCSGLPAYNSPRWTLNFGAQQTIPLGAFEIVAQADTQYRTSRYVGFAYLPEQKQGDVWRSNAQLSFGPSDDNWSISGFVRNIENKRTVAYSATTPLANALVAGTLAPRTYGVRGSFRF